MKALIRLPIDLLLWTAYVIPWFLLMLLGIPICWQLAKKKAWVEGVSRHKLDETGKPSKILVWRPRWAWLWSNDGDGIAADWWRERVEGEDLSKEAFLWTALRNPVNNLRFVPWIHPVPNVKRIRWVGNVLDGHDALTEHRSEGGGFHRALWCYAWQGIFAGFWLIWPLTRSRHLRLRIGWKILPRDVIAGAVTDYRQHRFPFGIQFTPWRRG